MSPPITIRRSGPDDGEAVTKLLAATYPVLMAPAYETDILSRALPLMVRANPVLLATDSFHLAAIPGRIIGCGGWTPERPGTGEIEPGLGHIRHFAVHPAWGGRGIGRALFEACREQARDRGIDVFECYASLNAEPFSRALGFIRLSRRDIAMGGVVRFPSMWMHCRLRPIPAGPDQLASVVVPHPRPGRTRDGGSIITRAAPAGPATPGRAAAPSFPWRSASRPPRRWSRPRPPWPGP